MRFFLKQILEASLLLHFLSIRTFIATFIISAMLTNGTTRRQIVFTDLLLTSGCFWGRWIRFSYGEGKTIRKIQPKNSQYKAVVNFNSNLKPILIIIVCHSLNGKSTISFRPAYKDMLEGDFSLEEGEDGRQWLINISRKDDRQGVY